MKKKSYFSPEITEFLFRLFSKQDVKEVREKLHVWGHDVIATGQLGNHRLVNETDQATENGQE